MCFLAKLPRRVCALKPLLGQKRCQFGVFQFASSHSQSVQLVLGPLPVQGCSPASVHLFGSPDVSQHVRLLTGSHKLDSHTSDLHEFPIEPSIA